MRWVTLLGRAQKGVLKGQMALGDAHPYLALFDWIFLNNKIAAVKLKLSYVALDERFFKRRLVFGRVCKWSFQKNC